MKRLLTVTAATALALTISACGGGDQGGQQQTGTATKQSQSAGPQIEVSDAELESFVEASMQLGAFRSEMQQRMSEAENQEEGREVRQRLMQERDSIVQAAGLEGGTQRYNAIMKAVKSNEQIRKRYTAIREQMESDTATATDTAS